MCVFNNAFLLVLFLGWLLEKRGLNDASNFFYLLENVTVSVPQGLRFCPWAPGSLRVVPLSSQEVVVRVSGVQVFLASIQGDPEESLVSLCHNQWRAPSVPGLGEEHSLPQEQCTPLNTSFERITNPTGCVAGMGRPVGETPVEGVVQEGLQKEVGVEGGL